MKKLTKKEALLRLIEEVKRQSFKYICPDVTSLFNLGEIDKETHDWIKGKMIANEVPLEFHGINWHGGEALWIWFEEEMRVAYLEYLIENLEEK